MTRFNRRGREVEILRFYFFILSYLFSGNNELDLDLPAEISLSKRQSHWCKQEEKSVKEIVTMETRTVKTLVVERCDFGDGTVPCRRIRFEILALCSDLTSQIICKENC